MSNSKQNKGKSCCEFVICLIKKLPEGMKYNCKTEKKYTLA